MKINRNTIGTLWIAFFVVNIMISVGYAAEPKVLTEGWNDYIHTGNTVNALSMFEKAYEEQPEEIKVASSYAQLLIQVGEYTQAANVLTTTFAICKWNQWCEPAIADLGSVVGYLKDTSELEKVLKGRLQNKSISWIEKNLVEDLLIRILLEKEEFDKARSICESARFVKDWMILGPFSNRNQQEFLVQNEFENTLAQVDLEERWNGRGRDISWQKVSAPFNGRVKLGMVVYPSEDSMGYMLCYVKAQKEGKAVFAIEESGASALWINGELKYVDSVYVDNDAPLQRVIGVDLKKGMNQVVMKVAAARDVLPEARLRVVAGNVKMMAESGSAEFVNNNSSNYNYSASIESAKEYAKSGNMIRGAGKMPAMNQGDSWGTAGALWGALAYFEEITSNINLNSFYEYPLALMNMGYLVNHYGFDSSERSRERVYDTLLIEKYPECPLFLNSAAYVQIGDNTKRELLLRAVAISPEEIAAQEGLMHLEVKGGFYDQAWKSAEDIASKSGHSFSTYSTIASIAERKNWTPEAAKYYSDALEYLSGAGWLYARKAANSGTVAEAISVLQEGRKRVFDVNLAEALGGWLYEDGKYEESEEVYRKILLLEKYVEEYWDAVGACRVAVGDLEGAVKDLKEGLLWMPQSPFLKEQIGRALLRIGQDEEALKYMKESLSIQQDNPSLAAYIQELSSNSAEFYAQENVDFDSLEGKGSTPADYPQFDRVCLLDQSYILVSKGGTTKRMIRSVIKVLRESAVNEVSVASIFYDSSRQKVELKHARVIQPTGEISENPIVQDGMYNSGFDAGGIYGSAQVKNIKLPNVKEGSIVDIMYTIEDMGANVYHDEFSDISYLGDVAPTLKYIYTAVVPTEMGVEWEIYSSDAKAEVASIDAELTQVRLELDDLEGVEIEPMMPPLQEVKPALVLSTFKSWGDLASWANGLFEPEIILPDDIKAAVHVIVKDAKTRKEKISAIYDYVTKNIRYVSISYGRFGYAPHKAERTFRAGYGDCKDTAALLVAMLEEVGIEAYPTLTRTRDQGALLSKLASPELFNHSIAYVPPQKEGDGKHYWLDGTTDFFLLGMIPAMDRGTESLIVKRGGGLIEIDHMEPDQDVQISHANFTIKMDGSGKVQTRETYKGRVSVEMRRALEKPEAFLGMVKSFVNNRFAGAGVDEFDYSKDNNKAESWYEFSVNSDKVAMEDAGELKMLPWIFPLDLSGVAVLRERKYDLDIGTEKTFEVITEIKLTDGLEVVAILADVDEDIEAVSYERKSEKTSDGIKIHSKIVLKKSRVNKDNYTEFREFINMISAKSREWLFIK